MHKYYSKNAQKEPYFSAFCIERWIYILLANGKAKAQAVYDTCFGSVKPQVPASILQLHEDCIVIADEDALSLCSEKGLV